MSNTVNEQPIYVALTDDNGDPIVGIVAEIRTFDDGRDDEWLIVDGLGGDYVRPATMVPVIDDERLQDLRRALDNSRKETR